MYTCKKSVKNTKFEKNWQKILFNLVFLRILIYFQDSDSKVRLSYFICSRAEMSRFVTQFYLTVNNKTGPTKNL